MKAQSKNMSIIDKDLIVEGTVSFKGQLIVKGTVKGTLSGEKVVIAEEGFVQARATVSEIVVGGVFEGELNAEKKLTVLASGQCSGKISCKKFEVETGGKLNAEVNCL